MNLPAFDPLAEGFDLWAQTFGVARFEPFLKGLSGHGGTVLDAGCGSGILAVHVADHAARVVGMDISRAMLAVAARRSIEAQKPNVEFVRGDLQALPFGDKSFDCVISSAALYNTRLETSLPELRRVVRPGGRILIADLVQRHPRLDRLPAWAILRALAAAPGHARAFGIRTMFRVLLFRTSQGWVRHYVRPKLTPAEFRDAYSRHLPGCRIKARRWDMFVFWEDTR
ncbi:MAG: class I SAM-dependent methyltransferase [Acidobacteria bacterium]|nr:class I SAM-dependent methyltransferase [Acidobacteriota bacterium]